MGDGRVIGVLSPFVGGTYYGTLVAGVSDAAARRGRRTIAVQVLDAAADMTYNGGNPAFDEPVAWRHAAGFVVLADAVTPPYLLRLIGAGKPVVLAGHEVPEVSCPAVLADNGSGIRDVVAHLVGHGHTRIAFTGYLAASDVAERHGAYRSALESHGLEPDPALFLPAHNNGCLRATDVAARFGGDEFLVLLPGVETGPALDDIGARLQAAIRAPFAIDGAEVRVGVSIGATGSDRHPTAEALLQEADAAMYRAKPTRAA